MGVPPIIFDFVHAAAGEEEALLVRALAFVRLVPGFNYAEKISRACKLSGFSFKCHNIPGTRDT